MTTRKTISVRNLKRLAKKIQKERGLAKLSDAQELAAREVGYEDWHHAQRTLAKEEAFSSQALVNDTTGLQEAKTMDEVLGLGNEPGLVLFLGRTAGFKTGVMSSIVANHVLKYYQSTVAGKTEEPPTIWGYLAENDIATYTSRVLTNILNRHPLSTNFGFGSFQLREFGQKIDNEPSFKEAVFKLVDTLMPNCLWMTSKKTEGKTNFSVADILNTFEKKMQAEHIRPRFIILDFLNLLALPRDMAIALSRAQELATITHLLDEWARQQGITIISAAQALPQGLPIDGAHETDYMAFPKAERMDEATSFANHSCMVISLLPFTEVLKGGTERQWMATQILKHPKVAKNAIFVSSLNERSNITFADSKHYSESEWIHLKETILSKKEQIDGGAS